jgi:hypothetical protein
LILHGGDLADSGSSPAEIVDRMRDLGWWGVVGNTDEMLFRPQSLEEFAEQSPNLQPFLATIRNMAAAIRETLGEERLAWLGGLPRRSIIRWHSCMQVRKVPGTRLRRKQAMPS